MSVRSSANNVASDAIFFFAGKRPPKPGSLASFIPVAANIGQQIALGAEGMVDVSLFHGHHEFDDANLIE